MNRALAALQAGILCALAASLATPSRASAQTPATPPEPLRLGPVELTYDAQAGRVRTAVRLSPAAQRFNGRIRVSVGTEMRNGTCFAGNAGDLRIDMTLAWDMVYGSVEAVGQGVVARVSANGGGVVEAFPSYAFSFGSRQLLGRGFRCVTDLSVTGNLPTDTSTATARGASRTALAATLPLTATATLAAAVPATFVGDFDSGLVPPWTSVQRAATDRYRLDTTRAAPGSTTSGRVEIRGGDPLVATGQRAEALWGQDSSLTLRAGDEYYFGWSTWFDSAFPSPGTASSTSSTGHCLFIQWKDFQTGSPPIDLECRLDRIQVSYTAKCGGWNIPLVRNGWNDFVVRVRFSATDGQIEIWHRAPGESALTLKLATCALPTLQPGEDSYLKLGYYRRDDETRTGVLWHDNLKVGTTFDAVAPSGATAAPPPADTTPPPIPSGVTATGGDTTVTVNWSPVSASDVAGYTVHRSSTAGGPYTQVGTTTSTFFTDTGRANGIPYYYVVRSVDNAPTPNESGNSAEVSATPAAPAPVTRTLTVVADQDTMVKQASPTSAFGGTNPLFVDTQATSSTSSAINSYLRFTIPALATGERIAAASLRLWATNGSVNGPALYRTATTWSEQNMTWSSGRPARTSSTAVGNFGTVTATAANSAALTGIAAAGQVSLELQPESTDDVAFSTRGTTTTASRPALVLTIQRG